MPYTRLGTCNNPYCRRQNACVVTGQVGHDDMLVVQTACYSCGGRRVTKIDRRMFIALNRDTYQKLEYVPGMEIPAPPPFGAGPATQKS